MYMNKHVSVCYNYFIQRRWSAFHITMNRTPKYYPVPKLCTGITVVPINCWKRSLCYKCYPCLFRLCSSSCSFKYEHYAYSVYRIFFIYTAPLIPQQMTLTFLQPSKKKKATVLFAEKEYMYMYVFSDTCKLIIL